MTAVLDLRTDLVTALSGVLGTYTLANGITTPAVDVRAIGQGRETGTTVAGVELVIQRDPTLRPVRAQEAEAVMPEWTAFLVEWDSSSGTAARAAQLAVAAIPGCEAEVVEVPENVGPVHQYRLLIRQSMAATETSFVLSLNYITTLSGLDITTLAGNPLVTL